MTGAKKVSSLGRSQESTGFSPYLDGEGGEEMMLFLEDIISLSVGFEEKRAPRLPTSFSSEAAVQPLLRSGLRFPTRQGSFSRLSPLLN